MIKVLGIPTYNRFGLLKRCVESIDHPVEKLVIINNSGFVMPIGIMRPDCVENMIEIRHPNAGVAASWNEIIMLFPANWWLLSNDDIQFAPGDLAKMEDAANKHPHVACLYGNHGASFWVVTKRGIEKAGTFDANFFPAYLEDCCFSYRCDLLKELRINVPGINSVHGDDKRDGSCTVNATPQLAAENSRTHGNNFEYYGRKYGGSNGSEKFKTPFNDPHWPIWAWKFEPAHRARQQWKPT
jgi:hypothetical protein